MLEFMRQNNVKRQNTPKFLTSDSHLLIKYLLMTKVLYFPFTGSYCSNVQMSFPQKMVDFYLSPKVRSESLSPQVSVHPLR